jgi:hypothetical protein
MKELAIGFCIIGFLVMVLGGLGHQASVEAAKQNQREAATVSSLRSDQQVCTAYWAWTKKANAWVPDMSRLCGETLEPSGEVAQ